MSKRADAVEKAFLDLMAHDGDEALRLITGMCICYTLEWVRRQGEDTDKEIHIEGGPGQRSFTIHKAN